MRKLMLASGLAAVGLFAVGCDTASSAGKTATNSAGDAAKGAKEAAGKMAAGAKDAAGAVGDAAKDGVVKPIEAMYEKIEAQIKGLTGDAATKAKDKFEVVKKLVEEFKKSPADGMKAVQEKLTTAFDELKKMVGL